MRLDALRWLDWVTAFYPLSITAQLWVRVLPPLVRHWMFEDRLGPLKLDAYIFSAGMRGPEGQGGNSVEQVTLACIVLLALPLLNLLRRRDPVLAGLGLTLIGLVACGGWLATVYFRNSLPARGALPAAIGFALLVIGLRWAAATVPGGYWKRVAFMLAGVALPTAILPYLLNEFGRSWFGVATTAPAIALAALAFWRLPSVPAEATLRSVAAGVLITVITFTAIVQGRQWQRERHDAEVQQRLASIPRRAPDASFPEVYFHRGVNFTANGYGYESEGARTLIGKLPAFGVQAVAVVPYGGMSRETLRISTAQPGTWASDAGVELITAEAH